MNPAWWPPLVLALPGALAVRRWCPGLGTPAQAGLGILLGQAGAPLLLFLAHVAGLPLSRAVVLGLLSLGVAGLAWWLRPRPSRGAPGADRPVPSRWLPAEILLLALLIGLVLSSGWKGAYYPIGATDAHSYDGRARWIVAEQTLALSVYDAVKATGATNISYPPVFPLDLAIGYWVGAPQGKVVDTWFYSGILLVMYGLLRSRLSRLGALLGALLLAGTPEIWNHASLGLINLPSMAFVGASFLLAAWLRETEDASRRRGAWWLAGILAAGAAGTRSDALLLALGGGALLLARSPDRWRRGVALLLPPCAVTILWQFYLRDCLGLVSSEPFRPGYLADVPTILQVAASLLNLLGHAPLLAYTFHLLPLGLLLAGVGRLARAPWAGGPLEPCGRHLGLLLVWSATLVALFQALDPRFGGGLIEILNTSFKRTCFYLVPPAVAGLLLLPPVRNGLSAFDNWQRGPA